MPAYVEDRDADIWEALLAVADLAGGHWPQTAREAATRLVAESKIATPSLGILLLSDIRDVFGNIDHDRLSTLDLLTKLNDLDESPWAVIRRGNPLNARGLANRLGKYGIGPQKYRDGEDTVRGYVSAEFEDAWSRYLGSPPENAEHPEQAEPEQPGAADVPDVPDSLEANPETKSDDSDDSGPLEPSNAEDEWKFCCRDCGTPAELVDGWYCRECFDKRYASDSTTTDVRLTSSGHLNTPNTPGAPQSRDTTPETEVSDG
jgi:hypothetical protein